MRLLDAFCGEGGAGEGYRRAGFEVVGVDKAPMPRNPHEFVQADALRFIAEHGHEFDAIHASPPCQAFSRAQRIRANGHPDLIGPTRELLEPLGLPYVIENVPGAPLREPVELCGTMFGLALYRHRWFEVSGFEYVAPLHGDHVLPQAKMGRPPRPGEIIQPVGNFSGAAAARAAMEMPWASRDGLAQAIPPAYTEHIGGYLLAAIRAGGE